MTTQKIKPAHKELMVRDPETLEPLSHDGEEKPVNAYWARRLAEGDVIEMNEAAAAAKKKPTKKQAAKKQPAKKTKEA